MLKTRLTLLLFLVRLIEEFPAIPVIAAGGIANGRSLAAVLAAGAEGAWVGMAFRVCGSSTPAHRAGTRPPICSPKNDQILTFS